MGPFPPSFGFVYILVAIDYVSKWAEAQATRTNDHKVVVKFVKKYIFCQYRTLRALISDAGSHLYHQSFDPLLRKYSVTHKIFCDSSAVRIPHHEFPLWSHELHPRLHRVSL